MNVKTIAGALGFALGMMAATGALATPIKLSNTRPVVLGHSAEPSMQSILDKVFGAGKVNAANDQQTAVMWGSTSSVFPTVTPVLSFEYTSNKNANGIGLWFGTDDSAVTTRKLFNGKASPGVRATIAWDSWNSGTIVRIGGAAGDVVEGAFTGIPWASFGFFLSGPGTGGKNFYTSDQLNDGNAYAVSYAGATRNGTNWVIGFEDSRGDRDFQDLVIRVESIDAVRVPEPGTLALLSAGLLGFSGLARRRRS